MSLFKEIKNIFISSSQTAQNTLFFLLESLFFLILASITGFLISSPIFYLATQFTASFQKSVLLTLMTCLLFFYFYRFVQAFKKESQILSSKISNTTHLFLISFIYSTPHFFPEWIKTLSYILLGLFLSITVLILITHSIISSLLNFLNLNPSFIQQAYQFTSFSYQFLTNIISSKPWIFFAVILELLSFTLITQAKPVLENNHPFNKQKYYPKLSITACFFLLTNFQIFALFLSLYILAIYFTGHSLFLK